MSNYYSTSDKELIQLWGLKLKELRLEKNISQEDLANKTGMSRSSIAAIEGGRNFSALSLISILRVLEKLDMVEQFFQQKEIMLSPMELYERQKKQRKRGGYQ